MKFSTIPAVVLALAGAVSAAPAGCKARTPTATATAAPAATSAADTTDSTCDVSVTAEQLAVIAPGTSSCTTTGGECSSAANAAKWINQAACDYGVTKNEMMAVLALIAFESGDFAYKVNLKATTDLANHAGQGTANMQSAVWNFQYANSIPACKSQLSQYASLDAMTLEQRNTVLLPLVTPDAYNFASGFWFLTKAQPAVCDAARTALNSDLSTGFTTYIENCVQTPITTERTAVLDLVIKAYSS